MKFEKLPAMSRMAEITRAPDAGDDDEEFKFEISISSEEPYRRWWGTEILGHQKGEVELGWMGSGRAPLLVDHDARVDAQVGTLEKTWLADNRLKAIVRPGKGERAAEIAKRVRDGELTSISVGYRINEMILVEEKDGEPTYRVTSWTPFEASIVAIPADMTVGVGRGGDWGEQPVKIKRSLSMEPETAIVPTAAAANTVPHASPRRDPSPDDILREERKRIAEIEALGAKFNNAALAREHIAKGTSIELFRGVLLDAVGLEGFNRVNENANTIGLSKKEAKQFRFLRLFAAHLRDATPAMKAAAAFEIEVVNTESDRVQKEGRKSRGLTIPLDVLRTPVIEQQRDLTVGTATAGGHTVATDLLSADFIALLRKRMLMGRVGARLLTGLEGNIAIPRQTSGATTTWVAESGNATESQMAFDQVTMSPKTVCVFSDISRRLLLQSSLDVEMLVRADLAMAVALEIDRVALHGSGASNQPTGIAATSGINTVAIGTNGGAPTWAHVVGLETGIAADDADVENMAYITNALVRGKLKTTEKAATTNGQFIWPEGRGADGFGELNGYRAGVTNQVRSDLTKGSGTNLSAIFFGNFNDLLIGSWSGLDVLVDPYTLGQQGAIRILNFQDVDLAVRHPESFNYLSDAVTT